VGYSVGALSRYRDFFYKISGRYLSASDTTFFYYLFSTILAFFAWLFASERGEVERSALVWPALMAVFLCLSVWSFSSATRILDMSAASTIRGLSFLPTVLLSVVVLHERPSLKTCMAMVLIALAVLLLGWDASAHHEADSCNAVPARQGRQESLGIDRFSPPHSR